MHVSGSLVIGLLQPKLHERRKRGLPTPIPGQEFFVARDRPLAMSADVEILGQFRERGRPLLGTQVLTRSRF